MGSGFSKMKKQARAMQEQYAKMQEHLKDVKAIGSSGNGLVTLTLTGDNELLDLHIKKECVDPDDLEGLQDLIIAAHAEARKKLQEQQEGNQLSPPFGF